MSTVLISPNMNLPSPIPGSTPGPEWSYDIASCLSILDSHDHSSGKGVQISPNGLNINADLPFNGNNITLLKTIRFSAQGAPITSSSPNVGCLYVSGNELYFNDATGGHQVQITTNGSVNAGAGSITGLPSGTASASFSSGTFVFQSATNTAANIDGRSIVLRNSSASSKGLTLNPPAAMAADFSLTLPTVPVSTCFLQIDSSGNFSGSIPVSAGLTTSNLSASAGILGSQLSASAAIIGAQISLGTITGTSVNGGTQGNIQQGTIAGDDMAAQTVNVANLNNPTSTFSNNNSAITATSGSGSIFSHNLFLKTYRPVLIGFTSSLSNRGATGGALVIQASSSVTFFLSIAGTVVSTVTLSNSNVSAVSFPPSCLNNFVVGIASGGVNAIALTYTVNSGTGFSFSTGLYMFSMQV